MTFPIIHVEPTQTVVEYRSEQGTYVLDYHLHGGFKKGEKCTLLNTGDVVLHAALKKLNSEDYTQTAFMDFVRVRVEPLLPEAKWVHHVPNGGKRTTKEGAKLKRQGVKKGVGDIFFPYYSTEGKSGVYIEFKQLGNYQSESQREFEKYIVNQNYVYKIALTPLEAVSILQDYTGLLFTAHLSDSFINIEEEN